MKKVSIYQGKEKGVPSVNEKGLHLPREGEKAPRR
jgi:hypothetical protein